MLLSYIEDSFTYNILLTQLRDTKAKESRYVKAQTVQTGIRGEIPERKEGTLPLPPMIP